MKRILAVVFVAVLVLPLTGQGQTWSSEQEEVWAAVKAHWKAYESNDIDARLATYSDGYRGWTMTDLTPMTKADFRPFELHSGPQSRNLATYLFPLAIDVYGEFAFVFYTYQVVHLTKAGDEENEQGKWLDVYRNENGRWLLIADSGGAVAGDDQGN